MENKMIMTPPPRVQDIPIEPSPSTINSIMAATPEDLLDTVEPEPMPPTTHGAQPPPNDLSLAYISRILMEEDIADKFSYQYPDSPKLLQAEQPFAQILSAAATASFGTQESSVPSMPASALMPSQDNKTDIKIQDPALLIGTERETAEPHSTLFSSERSTSMDELSSMAFFKGIEDASMFLPRDNGMVDGRVRKNRFDVDGETEAGMERSRKQIAVLHTDSEEEDIALKMLDRLVLNGYDKRPGEMREVRATLYKENKASQKSIRMRRRRGAKQMVVTDLETLLIRCAEAVASNDRRSAAELLERIKRYCSPTGDAGQRVAHYFSQGLEARLAGTGTQFYRLSTGTRTSTLELVKAYHMHMATCCFITVALLFSNDTIYKTVAGRRKLHIVHYGINTGYQWPKLIRRLADREGGPPEVRITGINRPQPGFRPAGLIEEAGDRLSNYANKFGVPFKFHAIAAEPEAVRAEDIHIDPDEVLVVNSIFDFRTLMDESLTLDEVNPRDMVLNTIRKMKPSVFVHAVVNGSYSAAFFMTRFRQALYYFTALFDMMETTFPEDSNKRVLVEREIFARSAMNMIACEGADRVDRPHNYKEWQARNQRAGLRQMPLNHDLVLMLKEEVKNQYHKNFMINEDHQWLLQGWKGQVLYALSTWTVDDTSGSEET